MEILNSKQQQLTFDKGITNVPSDALCSDNALDESLGLVYDNGEHRVIQKPKVKFRDFTDKILSVHKFNEDDRFIGQNGTTIKWYDKNGDGGTVLLSSTSGNVQVTSIGKTLIVSDGNGLHYFLWKGNGYESLGALPEPEFRFWLDGANISDLWVVNKGKSNDMVERTQVETSSGSIFIYKVLDGKQEDWNNLVVGLYAKNKKQIAQKKGFCLPFFVRTALELYDGSYTHISNPILLFPCVTSNSTSAEGSWELSIVTHYLKLMFTQTVALEKWNDIVKDVVIFASPGIEVYDLSVDQQAVDSDDNGNIKYSYFDYVKGYTYNKQLIDTTEKVDRHGTRYGLTNLYTFINKPVSEINEAIKGTSVFYKLCSIGLKPVSSKDVAEFIDTHTLENLTTQEFLKEDDYFSRSSLIARLIYAYNSRLNLAGVKRSIFEGFKFFTPFSAANVSSSTVYIETDSGNKVVEQSLSLNNGANLYFFYPDSRARAVTMNNQTYSLTEHPALNGAYYFAGIEKVISWSQPTGDGSVLQNSDSNPEILDNYIMTSEVNNPFLFKAEGYNRVGTGEVIGMSTLTQALSEGQFGQYPLLVFSESGIWAMSLSNTGTFNSVHPLSREVALKDNPCITQTDGAVFFASKKGLMVIIGSQVKCVSEQLSGRTNTFKVNNIEQTTDLGNFNTFLETATIAYDYRDSLLWIFDKPYSACWIYSIKSGTFGKFNFVDVVIDNVVNYYPDYLLQETGENVYSLLGRDNINLDADTYSGTIITRPMKLENALALKSILQVRHVKQFGGGQNELRLRIFASNNLGSWCELHSLGGMPWKYYRFRYDFNNLVATDRFGGTMLITQERRTNKLR